MSVEELVDIFGYDTVYEKTVQNVKTKRALVAALDDARKLYQELIVAENPHDIEAAGILADALWQSDNREELERLRMELRKSESQLAVLNGDKEAEKIDFDEIKNSVSLAGLIESYGLVVTKAGSTRYKVVCPFHHEKDPSLVVYGDNSFFCFGCKASGTVIDFVMKMDGCGAVEAAKKLR